MPPPVVFNGIGNIVDFFNAFENYGGSMYRNNEAAYLQILPSFLEDEARNIVLSFGTGNNINYQYQIVRNRMVQDFNLL